MWLSTPIIWNERYVRHGQTKLAVHLEVGARRVGIIQSLLVTCRLHGVEPYTYLVDVLQRIASIRPSASANSPHECGSRSSLTTPCPPPSGTTTTTHLHTESHATSTAQIARLRLDLYAGAPTPCAAPGPRPPGNLQLAPIAAPCGDACRRRHYAHPRARSRSARRQPRTGSYRNANRLLADHYRDKQGNRSTRAIEAYSLRRSQAGDVLLMAVRADSGQPRSYWVDSILGVKATQTSFTPQYPIELTPSGPQSIPRIAKPSSGSTFGAGHTPTIRRSPARRSTRSTSFGAASGPTYVFKCTVCGKTFNRKSYDAKLNKHKNKRSGYECYGTIGIFVRTKY